MLMAAAAPAALADAPLSRWRIVHGPDNPGMVFVWPGEAMADAPCPIARDAPGAISTEFLARGPDAPWKPGTLRSPIGETLIRTRLRPPVPWTLIDLNGRSRVFGLVEAIAMTGRQREGADDLYRFGACKLYATRPPTDRPEDLRERGHWPSLDAPRKVWLLHTGPLDRTPPVQPVAPPLAFARAAEPAPPAEALAVLDLPAVHARLGPEAETVLGILQQAKVQAFRAVVDGSRGQETVWSILWYGQRSEQRVGARTVRILGDSLWGLYRQGESGPEPLHLDIGSGNVTELPYGGRVLAVADLDADGIDELVIENDYWEGKSVDIGRWQDGKLELAFVGGYEGL